MNAAGPDSPDFLAVETGFATHVGKVRRENEDRYFVAADVGVFAVADGMGGHEGGALASATVVDALASIGSAVSAADLLARLEDRVVRANAALWSISSTRRKVIGSTVAVLLTFQDHFACVWSGDSRIYLVRGGTITQISRDHTEARDLVDRGILTSAEARSWPRRHVITRAVGVRPEPELELENGMLEAGDTFVICSDGLMGHVADAEILAVTSSHAPQAACDALLALTLQRGALDNVTLVIVRCVSAGTAPRPQIPTATIVLPGQSPPTRGGGGDR